MEGFQRAVNSPKQFRIFGGVVQGYPPKLIRTFAPSERLECHTFAATGKTSRSFIFFPIRDTMDVRWHSRSNGATSQLPLFA